MFMTLHEIGMLLQLETAYERAARTLGVKLDEQEIREYRAAARKAYGPLSSVIDHASKDDLEATKIAPNDDDRWKLTSEQKKIMRAKEITGERAREMLKKYMPFVLTRARQDAFAYLAFDNEACPQLALSDIDINSQQLPDCRFLTATEFKGIEESGPAMGNQVVVSMWNRECFSIIARSMQRSVDPEAVDRFRVGVKALYQSLDLDFDKAMSMLDRRSPEIDKKLQTLTEGTLIATNTLLATFMPIGGTVVHAIGKEQPEPYLMVFDRPTSVEKSFDLTFVDDFGN